MYWFIDQPTTLFLVLGGAAFGLATAWWMTRKRPDIAAAGVAAALLVVVWLLSTFIDTDAKRIERTILDMGSGVEANDLNRIFSHISSDFSAAALDRAAFRDRAENFMRAHRPAGIVVWDYEPIEISRPDGTATVIFKVKTHGIDDARGVPFYNCRANFVLGQDGEWRMRTFQLFLPTVDPLRGDPIALPF